MSMSSDAYDVITGDSYFVDANYEAAVGAYTKSLAIKEDATKFQRRAAAYLALKDDTKVRSFDFYVLRVLTILNRGRTR